MRCAAFLAKRSFPTCLIECALNAVPRRDFRDRETRAQSAYDVCSMLPYLCGQRSRSVYVVPSVSNAYDLLIATAGVAEKRAARFSTIPMWLAQPFGAKPSSNTLRHYRGRTAAAFHVSNAHDIMRR